MSFLMDCQETGTYKFGQEPTAEDLKYLNKTENPRAAAAKAGTHRYNHTSSSCTASPPLDHDATTVPLHNIDKSTKGKH